MQAAEQSEQASQAVGLAGWQDVVQGPAQPEAFAHPMPQALVGSVQVVAGPVGPEQEMANPPHPMLVTCQVVLTDARSLSALAGWAWHSPVGLTFRARAMWDRVRACMVAMLHGSSRQASSARWAASL